MDLFTTKEVQLTYLHLGGPGGLIMSAYNIIQHLKWNGLEEEGGHNTLNVTCSHHCLRSIRPQLPLLG